MTETIELLRRKEGARHAEVRLRVRFGGGPGAKRHLMGGEVCSSLSVMKAGSPSVANSSEAPESLETP